MKTFSIVTATIAFFACFLAGAALVTETGLSFDKDSVLLTAIGLYFIGKAVFVGAMLWMQGNR